MLVGRNAVFNALYVLDEGPTVFDILCWMLGMLYLIDCICWMVGILCYTVFVGGWVVLVNGASADAFFLIGFESIYRNPSMQSTT